MANLVRQLSTTKMVAISHVVKHDRHKTEKSPTWDRSSPYFLFFCYGWLTRKIWQWMWTKSEAETNKQSIYLDVSDYNKFLDNVVSSELG